MHLATEEDGVRGVWDSLHMEAEGGYMKNPTAPNFAILKKEFLSIKQIITYLERNLLLLLFFVYITTLESHPIHGNGFKKMDKHEVFRK